MSKPDAAGAKSLEEILASIRKSLGGAGEGSDAASALRGAAPMPAQAAPAREPAADAAGDGDGLLSARLAGALNGPTNGAAHDDDFTELLAPDTKKAAPPEPAPAGKPADARSEGKDPLWFLRRPSAAAEANGAQAPTVRAQSGEGAPAPIPAAVEEVKLSRPEVLRASLPPLFGADATRPPSPAAARTMPPDALNAPSSVVAPPAPMPAAARAAPSEVGKAGPTNILLARTQPLLPPVHPADEPAKTVPAAEPALAAGEPTFFRAATPAPVAVIPPEPQPPAEAKPNGLLTDTAANAAPTLQREPTAAKPAPTAEAPQARSLEQVIGELLEPVVRQWLDANLPRLVEEVVRVEVARAIAAERSAPKV